MANEKQITYWNEVAGPKWVKIAQEMDVRFADITRVLLAGSNLFPGAKILDVGCGTGSVAALMAERAGAGGTVTGIDISAPMLSVARSTYDGITNLTFLQADAQICDFQRDQFDIIVSRFGVMFFENAVTAFTNLGSSLAPGGRLSFVCWAPLAANPHWNIPFDIAVAALGAPEERPARSPGPLAFADRDYVTSILSDAGFSETTITPTPVQIIGQSLDDETRIAMLLGPSGALLDEKQADEQTRETVRARIRSAFAPFDGPHGIKLAATVYLVTARK